MMYVVAVSTWETKYIECKTKGAALLIANDEADANNSKHNIRVYEVADGKREFKMAISSE